MFNRSDENWQGRPDYGKLLEVCLSFVYSSLLSFDEYRRLLPGDKSCVVDGGANAGAHTIPLCRLVGPTGRVFAFEPNPVMQEQLLGYFKWTKTPTDNLVLRSEALSDKSGAARFVVLDQSPALSHIEHAWDGPNSAQRDDLHFIDVACDTLDAMLPTERPCFIKFDLEGAEFPALVGAERILRDIRPIVFFESDFDRNSRMYRYSKDDVFAYFKRVGYDVYSILGMIADNWASPHHELMALPQQSPASTSTAALVEYFWTMAKDKPPIKNWQESTRIYREIFAWIEPFRMGT